MPDHEYNDPNISMLGFLQAVARDPTVPSSLRIRAAELAMPYEYHPPVILECEPPRGHRVTIIIGGLPPGYDTANVSVEAKVHAPVRPLSPPH